MSKYFIHISISIGMVLTLASCSSASYPPPDRQIPADVSSPMFKASSNLSIGGTVQEIGSNEITILSSENKTIRLRFTTGSRIWDGIEWIAEIPIEIGDDVIATGSWEENDLVFVVQNLYINIVFLKGIADEVDKESFRFKLSDLRQGENTVTVSPLTMIYLSDSNQQGAFQDIQTLPTTSEYIEVIGREFNDGTVIAVTITLP